MTPISFITVIKNRTNIQVSHNNKEINLRLFENNLLSLISLIEPSDKWEFVIVDFESTDVNMADFVDTLPKKENLIFKIFTIKERFDKGRGLNYGATHATNEIVFFLDADMKILTRELFNDIETYVVKDKKVLFPICWSYLNPEHTTGSRRDSGTGNVIQYKNTIIRYVNNKTYGHEDTLNYNYFKRNGMAYRTFYHHGFVHQWHPIELRYISYKNSK
jgi:glycosyltransferase involved in cell wall biosynthesis